MVDIRDPVPLLLLLLLVCIPVRCLLARPSDSHGSVRRAFRGLSHTQRTTTSDSHHGHGHESLIRPSAHQAPPKPRKPPPPLPLLRDALAMLQMAPHPPLPPPNPITRFGPQTQGPKAARGFKKRNSPPAGHGGGVLPGGRWCRGQEILPTHQGGPCVLQLEDASSSEHRALSLPHLNLSGPPFILPLVLLHFP